MEALTHFHCPLSLSTDTKTKEPQQGFDPTWIIPSLQTRGIGAFSARNTSSAVPQDS